MSSLNGTSATTSGGGGGAATATATGDDPSTSGGLRKTLLKAGKQPNQATQIHDHSETNGAGGGGGGTSLFGAVAGQQPNGSSVNNSDNNGDLSNTGSESNNRENEEAEFMLASSRFSTGQRDILRLIGQHLRLLGLEKTTETLIKESGCLLEHPTAATFCQLIMRGQWDQAESTLERLKSIMGQSQNDITNMRFLILEQKYLEFLEDGKILEALKCLRDELAPLKYNTERLHELSSFLMCPDQTNLKTLSKWAGKSELSRKALMDKLQTFLPPNIMLPPRRLEALLMQSIEHQCEKCPYHNFKEKFGVDEWCFLRDHECSKDDFPSVTLQILNEHCDEVWFCKFSNNGKKLATGSKDGCLIVWDVDPDTYKLTLNKSYDDHSYGVALVAWSPDDRYLIVCGTEECSELWVWDVENKVLKKKLNNSHEESLTSAAWFPDGQSFVTGGIKGHFYNCDLDGNIKETWEGVRVRGLQTIPNDNGLVLAADNLKRIRAYNFRDLTDSNLIQEDFQIVSFTLNKSGTQCLISVASQGVHLWDVKDKCLVRRFQGSVQNNYMNFSTFGGAGEIYIASGSEDNKVYIWNIRHETPICVLEGHTRSVTCVSWNPEVPGMIVSASDDGTLRVWGPKCKLDANSSLNIGNHHQSLATAMNAGNNSNNNIEMNNNQNNVANNAVHNHTLMNFSGGPQGPSSSSSSSSSADRARLFASERFLSRSNDPSSQQQPQQQQQQQPQSSNSRTDRSTPV